MCIWLWKNLLHIDKCKICNIVQRHTWFVVAVMTPTGRVKNKARLHASKMPHHGN